MAVTIGRQRHVITLTQFSKENVPFTSCRRVGHQMGLALSVLTPPYGTILAHAHSHIHVDECAGPEFLTGGAKILPLQGFAGKLTPETISDVLIGYPYRAPHSSPSSALSITQGTECGSVYTHDELSALCACAKEHGLKIHMDGARFCQRSCVDGCIASRPELACRCRRIKFWRHQKRMPER